MPEKLSPREAARAMKVSLNRVYTLIWSGQLQAEQTGGRWSIPAAAIQQRLQTRRP